MTLIVSSAIPIGLAAGISIDYERTTSARRDLQAAMDAAVRTGARDGTLAWAARATDVLHALVKTTDLTIVSTSFSLDASGRYSGSATGSVKLSFAGLLAMPSLPVAVSATATPALLPLLPARTPFGQTIR